MNLEKYTKKIGIEHVLIVLAVIVGLWYMGVIQSFFGAVVADQALETSMCGISGEVWSPDTLKCQCPAGMGYEVSPVRVDGKLWKCASLAAAPAAVTEKPAAAVAEEQAAKSQNMLIGAGIIAVGIVGGVLLYKRKK